MESQETDIDYILSHFQNPESLLDAEFLEWLQHPARRQLFEEIRNYRETFMRVSLEGAIDTAREYERHRGKILFLRRKNRWRWTAAVACVAMVLVMPWVLWHFQRMEMVGEGQPILLEGRQTAELILASGERIHLENNPVAFLESNGTLIVNDSNCHLVYHRDSLADGGREGGTSLYNTLVIPAGADYTLWLADGTKVRLNCETKFRFPVEFSGSERRVFLDGEAYFEVEKATDRPFIVETNCMQVKVTGTCFNVKSYEGEEVVHATLVNGAVEVSNDRMPGGWVGLTPSQQYCLNKSSSRSEVKEVDVTLYTGWTEGMFVFKKQRLEEVMNTLSRWYTIEVSYLNESLKDLRISANLGRYEHIDSLLEVLRAMDKINVERKEKVVIISRK